MTLGSSEERGQEKIGNDLCNKWFQKRETDSFLKCSRRKDKLYVMYHQMRVCHINILAGKNSAWYANNRN